MVKICLDFYLPAQLHRKLLIQTASVYLFESANKTWFFVLSHKNFSEFALSQLFSQRKIIDEHVCLKPLLFLFRVRGSRGHSVWVTRFDCLFFRAFRRWLILWFWFFLLLSICLCLINKIPANIPLPILTPYRHGFFQLIGHGLLPQARIFTVSRTFFEVCPQIFLLFLILSLGQGSRYFYQLILQLFTVLFNVDFKTWLEKSPFGFETRAVLLHLPNFLL